MIHRWVVQGCQMWGSTGWGSRRRKAEMKSHVEQSTVAFSEQSLLSTHLPPCQRATATEGLSGGPRGTWGCVEGGDSEAQGLAASGTQNEAGKTCQSEHMEDLLRCVPRGLFHTPLFLLRSLLPSLPLTCPAISPIDFLTSSGFLD